MRYIQKFCFVCNVEFFTVFDVNWQPSSKVLNVESIETSYLSRSVHMTLEIKNYRFLTF